MKHASVDRAKRAVRRYIECLVDPIIEQATAEALNYGLAVLSEAAKGPRPLFLTPDQAAKLTWIEEKP